jgi:hypothetical protein
VVRRQGVEPLRVGPVRGYTKKYAHHVMLRKHIEFFKTRGINIHHPKHMTWWYRPSHQRFAARYNRQWGRWIEENPGATKARVLRKADQMRAKYAAHYPKLGPAGCKPRGCRASMPVALQ